MTKKKKKKKINKTNSVNKSIPKTPKYKVYDIPCDKCKKLISVTIRRKLPKTRNQIDKVIIDYLTKNNWNVDAKDNLIISITCPKCNKKC